MASKNPIVRALKKDDLKAFYDEPFAHTVRGLAVELNGEPVAVAGVIATTPYQAFSSIKDELRKFPKAIMKTGKKFKEILNSYESTVYAYADDEEKNSKNFLKHLGFVPIDDDGMFKWVRW